MGPNLVKKMGNHMDAVLGLELPDTQGCWAWCTVKVQ